MPANLHHPPGHLKRWWFRKSLRTKGVLALILPLLMLLLSTGAFAVNRYESQRATDLVTHTVVVQRDVNNALALVVDAETGVRGHIITGEPQFLEPYNLALAQLPGSLNDLQALVSDNPAEVKNVQALRTLTEYRLSILAEQSSVVLNDTNHAYIVALVTLGKQITDQIRAQITKIYNVEQHLLNIRVANARSIEHTTRWIVVLSVLLGVICDQIAMFILLSSVVKRLDFTVGNAALLAGNQPVENPEYIYEDEIGQLDNSMIIASDLLITRTEEMEQARDRSNRLLVLIAQRIRGPVAAMAGWTATAVLEDTLTPAQRTMTAAILKSSQSLLAVLDEAMETPH